MIKPSIITKAISILLVMAFITSQGYAGETISSFSNSDKLAASLLSDGEINPQRSDGSKENVAETLEPGAIGNGELLVDLIKGVFPPKLSLTPQRYSDIEEKLRSAIKLALQLYSSNQPNITDTSLKAITHRTSDNLVNFDNFLSRELYPFNAPVAGPENYLIGFTLDEFNREEKGALAINFIDWLYAKYKDQPRTALLRLAQYVSHERTPEKTIIKEEVSRTIIDRSDHKRIYEQIQSAIFGKDEVLELKKDLREFINERMLQSTGKASTRLAWSKDRPSYIFLDGDSFLWSGSLETAARIYGEIYWRIVNGIDVKDPRMPSEHELTGGIEYFNRTLQYAEAEHLDGMFKELAVQRYTFVNSKADYIKLFELRLQEQVLPHLQLMPGAKKFLEALAQKKREGYLVKIYVLSYSSQFGVDLITRHLGIRDFFDGAFGSPWESTHDTYNKTQKILEIAGSVPEAFVAMGGDSCGDVRSAIEATKNGCPTMSFGAPSGTATQEELTNAGALFVVDSLGQTQKIFDHFSFKEIWESAEIKKCISTLMPFAEKLLSQDIFQPDFGELKNWLAEHDIAYRVDFLNSAILDSGLVVIPVMLAGEWQYLMVLNRHHDFSAAAILTIMNDPASWIKNEKLCGVVSSSEGLEAFIATREGMEAIVWKEAKEKEYQAIWTDWDETVTFEREKPKPEVLKKLLSYHKRGVRIAIGSRRRVSFLENLVSYFKSVGATEDELKGILVYLEDGAVLYDLGDIEHPIYVNAVSLKTKQGIIQFLNSPPSTYANLQAGILKIEPDEGESRIRVYLKKDVNIPAYLTDLNKALRVNIDRMGQKLEARFDAGSTEPRIMIGPAGVEKAMGVRDYSKRTGIPLSLIAKFDDQGQSGQEDVMEGQDPLLMRGNGWSAVRLEGGFSVNRADRSSVFPIRSSRKSDAGFLEFLDMLRFVPAVEHVPLPDLIQRNPLDGVVLFTEDINAGHDVDFNRKRKDRAKALLDEVLSRTVQGPLALFRRMAESTQQHFIKHGYDTYSEGLAKIRAKVLRQYRSNMSRGSGVLIATHGGAGSGKTTTAALILRDLKRMLGVRGKVKSIDDWLYQSQLRPDSKTKYMPGYEQCMRDLSKGETVFTPMYDDEAKGNLLFGRGDSDKEIVLYDGKRMLIITYNDNNHYSFRDIEVDSKTGSFVKEIEVVQPRSGITHHLLMTTPVTLEMIDGRIRIAVRNNDHWVDGELRLMLPDGSTKDLKKLKSRPDLLRTGLWNGVKEDQAVWAQDALTPGLNLIEGTRVLNNQEIAGVAENGEFVTQGLFDETVELGGTSFETRRVRAIHRTQDRGFGLDMVERELNVFTEKQEGSELENIPAGRRARVHIAIESITESVWQKCQSGELIADSGLATTLRKDIGLKPKELIDSNERASARRIMEVILDHVAKAGIITYPGDPSRFAAPTSQYDTFSAGFLEIKVSRGKNNLDRSLIDNYRKLKERGRRILDPGQIVDLSEIGPIPIDRGHGVEYIVFGEVLIQNHIPWLQQRWEESLKKAKNDESVSADKFRLFVDKFFNLQHLMWRRGIIDANPDMMWRYGRSFIEGKLSGPNEEVVATTTSSMHLGKGGLDYFDPEVYLKEEIVQRIPATVRPYYEEQVRRRIFDILHYHPDQAGPVGKEKSLAVARETLHQNFFENDLPESMRTITKVFPSEMTDQETPIKNISVSHPFIDWNQINFLTQWVLTSEIKKLRADCFPQVDRVATPRIVWTKLVLDAQENVNTGFYRILKAFYELLLDNPKLLDEQRGQRRSDQEIFNLIRESYEQPYLKKGLKAPLLGRRAWGIFSFFLDEAKSLDDEWQAGVDYRVRHQVETASPAETRKNRRMLASQAVSRAIEEGDDDLYSVRPGSFDAPVAVLFDVAENMPIKELQRLTSKEAVVYDINKLPQELESPNAAVALMKIARKHETSSRRILLISSNPEHIKLATIIEVPIVGVIPPMGKVEQRKMVAHELVEAGSDFVVTGFSQTSKILDAVGLKQLANTVTHSQAQPKTSINNYDKIFKDLPERAKEFAVDLTEILAKHSDQLFFMGIESDIGESQKAQIMPIYKAVDEIRDMKDASGKPLFPNLMVRREKAEELVRIAADLAREGKLNLNNTFIGARKLSVDNKLYDSIKGEGKAWLSAIDDSNAGDYIPVFEAITLNMMAYLNADTAAIKNFYDAIADHPIDPGVLQEMLKNRIIYILPKMTKFNEKQLRDLYELAQQVYVAA